ncbi:hypothetical protein BY458DRAFT_434500 [Sporodiniella umbellata]|nr:hypothetical protein BY458DRAFT_434500 [Sporodiniella umbellata]
MFYELSTVFLNIHWFMDKLGYTGSKLQMVNGAMLLLSFFGVRIVFGVTMSIRLWCKWLFKKKKKKLT